MLSTRYKISKQGFCIRKEKYISKSCFTLEREILRNMPLFITCGGGGRILEGSVDFRENTERGISHK